MSYQQVSDALASGADPDMLCMTCPWDRNCISPPSMTRADVDRHMEEAAKRDDEQLRAAQAGGRPAPLPTATLVAAAVMAGRDTSAPICPVLGVRLGLPEGRGIVDRLKAEMQAKR